MKSYYTKKEYEQLLKNLVILYDTREQENSHITQWFDKKKVKCEKRSMQLGDYGFRIGNDWYVDEVFIERKNSLSELAQSVLEERFQREIKLASVKSNKYLIVEDGSWEGILNHDYRSSYNPKAFWNTLHTYMCKYNIQVIFTPKEMMGQVLYSICKSVINKHILHG